MTPTVQPNFKSGKKNCSVHACARAVLCRSLCNMHYLRLKSHGTTDDPRPTTEQQFWEKVNKTDSCWLWTGGVGRGYGIFYRGADRGGSFTVAHRYAYEALVGPIPAGLTLDHLCRVRGCVNPAHLEPVTQAENVRRGWKARS